MEHHHHLHHEMDLSLLDSFNPLDLMSVISIVSFSFFASLHCIGMCGPLVCLKMGGSNSKQFQSMLFYNLGRLVSYTSAGAFLGKAGSRLFFDNESLSRGISIVLGVLILELGIWSLTAKKPPSLHALNLVGSTKLKILDGVPRMFILGLLTVFLPCMTLTPVLGMSIASGSALAGGLLLFAFYVGTIPAMVATGVLPAFVFNKKWLGSGQKISQVFFCLAGIITILRAFH